MSIFGNQQGKQGTGLFGSTQANQGTGLFGNQQGNQGGGLFGNQQGNQGGGLFGNQQGNQSTITFGANNNNKPNGNILGNLSGINAKVQGYLPVSAIKPLPLLMLRTGRRSAWCVSCSICRLVRPLICSSRHRAHKSIL